ncbi:MAG TPA: glycosyltransferase family 39 protein, partial [Prolixibacteraceae bacterium]|nr:glycosyltransferase family 39 protein [Prolixibacteraceae bacterium]
MNRHSKQYSLLVILIIILTGTYFQKNHINEFPSHIHAWAQSDRYALALGFTNNNLNFFKPETFTLNHQFPDKWTTPTEHSVTAVDFPIHDYIPAVVMKITNNRSPWIFRVYILLYSFLGLFFLFRLSFLITQNFLKSILATLFAATSPIFIYYQGGFLPTIPSLANGIIGIYFYSCYLKEQRNRDFTLSLLFITLAALSRTTFAITLIALFAVEFIRFLNGEIKLKPKITPIVVSVAILLGYFLYNQHLRNEYGSNFLSHFLPPENLKHAFELIGLTLQNWEFHYFTKAHYIIITGIFLIASIVIIRKSTLKSHFNFILILLSVIMLSGCALFSVLMMQQFPAHDYYFLDTFFLPVVLLFSIALSFIPLRNKMSKTAAFVMFIIFACFSVNEAINKQEERRVTGAWDKTMATINNFENADAFLDSLAIPNNAKILTLGAYAPNIPFILMDKKGYAVMSTQRENIDHALSWDYDYAVMQNQFILSDIYSSYPEIINKLDEIAGNGKISIYRKEKNPREETLTA